ncbi:hypothetical protein OAH12_01000 [Cyclobacteriaceae bacterium]|nr:hypothetical protein [Cyclobacteriaceae bacterium]
MKKVFKGLIYFFGFIFLLLFAAILLPIFFKDEIKIAIDEQIEQSVDAQVIYDIDKFGLTMFKDFPNMTIEIEDFGIINNAPFKGDTLAMIGEFGVSLDLMSVFSGDQLAVNKIYIDEPTIKILVNEDGKANYDIAKGEPEEDTTTTEEAGEPFKLALNHWEITNARIVYDDKTTATLVELNDFNHYGNGTIAEVYDLALETSVDDLHVTFDGTTYYPQSTFDSDITINIDMREGTKITLKENKLSINEFTLGFDGWVHLLEEDINMDMKFAVKETSFKSFLSLVPGMFLEGFDDIKTSGTLAFDGFAKGTYNETTLPGFLLNLKVNEGMFQYPDLPTAVENINIDLKVDNEDANMDNIIVALNKFHLDLGKNPVDANMLLHVINSEDLDFKDANLKTQLNLEQIADFYPMDDMALKGLLKAHAKVNGLYSEKKNAMPTLSAGLNLDKGWVNAKEYNVTAKDISCNLWAKYNENLTDKDTILVVDHFGLTLDGQRFGSALKVWNLKMKEELEELEWDFSMNGSLDLEKLMKLSPIEGTTIEGLVEVDHLQSIGKLSDVEAENYNAIKTHGKATISEFVYIEDELLPQGFKITKSEMTIDPKNINLISFDGFVGKSDMKMNGNLSNYMGYVDDIMKDTITPHGTLKGKLNYHTNIFHTDEWLDTTEVVEEASVVDTANLDITENAVPKNIHFVMDASIDKILYDNMEIKSAEGDLVIKDGIVAMSGLKMTILGGRFVMDGQYNTFDPYKPTFDFAMNIDKLSFQESYETFNTVKKLAPIAKNIEGTFSTDLKFNGPLDAELMPVYDQLSGFANFFVMNGKVKDLAVLEKITDKAKIYKTDQLTIENTRIKTRMEDGKTIIEPFDAKSGNTNFNIGGSRTLDGNLDLDVNIDMPAKQVGKAINGVLNAQGIGNVVGDRMKMDVKVTGPEDNPKINIKGVQNSEGETTVKDAAVGKAKEEVTAKVDEQKEAQKKQILADAKKQADKVRAEAKVNGKKAKDEYYWQAADLEKKATNALKKVAAKKTADELRKKGDNQEKQIVNEGNKKADNIMKEAQAKADKI